MSVLLNTLLKKTSIAPHPYPQQAHTCPFLSFSLSSLFFSLILFVQSSRPTLWEDLRPRRALYKYCIIIVVYYHHLPHIFIFESIMLYFIITRCKFLRFILVFLLLIPVYWHKIMELYWVHWRTLEWFRMLLLR